MRQDILDLGHGHAGLDTRVVQDVQDVLVVDVEKSHRHGVVEHRPRHVGVVDRSERLQQFFVSAIEEDEVAIIDRENDVGMLDLELLVLAEAGQALRIQRLLDLAGAIAAVEGRDRAVEITVPHQLDHDVGVLAAIGHGDVEMLHMPGDLADDLGELRFPVAAVAVDEHAYRQIVFSDAVDTSGKMIFGAERGLQKPIDDLAIGERLFLGALLGGDDGDFRRRRRQPGRNAKRSARDDDREILKRSPEPEMGTHHGKVPAIGATAQGLAGNETQFFTMTVVPTDTRP